MYRISTEHELALEALCTQMLPLDSRPELVSKSRGKW